MRLPDRLLVEGSDDGSAYKYNLLWLRFQHHCILQYHCIAVPCYTQSDAVTVLTSLRQFGRICALTVCCLWQHHCMPISLAYCTHCAPPQKVLPKRSRKISPDFSAGFLTYTSCTHQLHTLMSMTSLQALTARSLPKAHQGGVRKPSPGQSVSASSSAFV